jgi:hypothetical protein
LLVCSLLWHSRGTVCLSKIERGLDVLPPAASPAASASWPPLATFSSSSPSSPSPPFSRCTWCTCWLPSLQKETLIALTPLLAAATASVWRPFYNPIHSPTTPLLHQKKLLKISHKKGHQLLASRLGGRRFAGARVGAPYVPSVRKPQLAGLFVPV